jgi:Domain of unknown function (DUF4145)
MATKKPPHIERLHCNSCRITTKHLLLKTHSDSGSDEEQEFYWRTDSDMFECCGCSSVLLRQVEHFSEDPDPTVKFYPPPASRWLPRWRWSIPNKLARLLGEIYAAMQADGLSLAMMGARAILDTAIIDTVGDQGSFTANLKAMQQKGDISAKNVEYLMVVFDAGSASAHRSHRPDHEQLNTVMDIVENLLQSLFVFEKKTKALKSAIPPRPAKVVAAKPAKAPPIIAKSAQASPPPAKP